jgi:hypothetical protein
MSEPSLPEESIFAQALEIRSAVERAAFLERVCGANHALRAEVEALLRAHERAGDARRFCPSRRRGRGFPGEVRGEVDDAAWSILPWRCGTSPTVIPPPFITHMTQPCKAVDGLTDLIHRDIR